mmetsp:Transcript_45438/g.81739  ORF Transcript_45438/g.81739 Transcript_45438/m.81739 type:complete len:338 (-) Transcript_45438:445-1458(-)
MPISAGSMFGSGEITERAAKFTRLPIIFMRKRPSFFSSSWRMPFSASFACLPLFIESIMEFTADCKSTMAWWSAFFGVLYFLSLISGSSPSDLATSLLAIRMPLSCVLWRSKPSLPSPRSLFFGGLKRFGGTKTLSKKKTFGPRSFAEGTNHLRTGASFFQSCSNMSRTYCGKHIFSWSPFFIFTKSVSWPSLRHLACALHLAQAAGRSFTYWDKTSLRLSMQADTSGPSVLFFAFFTGLPSSSFKAFASAKDSWSFLAAARCSFSPLDFIESLKGVASAFVPWLSYHLQVSSPASFCMSISKALLSDLLTVLSSFTNSSSGDRLFSFRTSSAVTAS